MKEEKTEGIVLKSQPFQDKHRIVSVLTQKAGLIQLIVKGISLRTPHLLTLTTPFTRAEFHYFDNGSSLLRFSEGSVLDEQLQLRLKFEYLKAAGAMTQALLRLLLPGSPDPLLYILYKNYLKQIQTFADVKPLVASFYVKLMKHEGLLQKLPFATSDLKTIQILSEIRSFENLRELKLSQELAEWTESGFANAR